MSNNLDIYTSLVQIINNALEIYKLDRAYDEDINKKLSEHDKNDFNKDKNRSCENSIYNIVYMYQLIYDYAYTKNDDQDDDFTLDNVDRTWKIITDELPKEDVCLFFLENKYENEEQDSDQEEE